MIRELEVVELDASNLLAPEPEENMETDENAEGDINLADIFGWAKEVKLRKERNPRIPTTRRTSSSSKKI